MFNKTKKTKKSYKNLLFTISQLDAQLKEMAGHQVSQTTGGVTGGIVPGFTGLTDILGAPLTDVMQGEWPPGSLGASPHGGDRGWHPHYIFLCPNLIVLWTVGNVNRKNSDFYFLLGGGGSI